MSDYQKIREQLVQIAKLESPIEREQWIKALANNAGVPRQTIRQELQIYERQLPTSTDTEPKYTEQEKTQALELLNNTNLIENFLATCHTKYLGRDRELLLLKLATLTRHFDMGLSVVVTGTSSVGKSELIKTILLTIHRSDREGFTRTSEQYLLYREKPLDHKVITYYEMHGTKSSSYLLRTALSEGNLKLGTVISNSKTGIMPKDIEKSAKGLVILSTTTEQSLDEELETRLLKLEITHDENLARQVYLHDEDVDDGRFRLWQAADSLLKPIAVEIPFEKAIANLFSTKEERYLRDFKKVRLLIKASALFHQYQRHQNNNVIVATEKDYDLIYSFRDLISQSVNVVNTHIINFLQTAKNMTFDNEFPTRIEIQNAINKSYGTIKRYINTALDKDLIQVSGKGKKQKIEVLDIPEPKSALPAPEDIFLNVIDPMIQTAQVFNKQKEFLDHPSMIQNDPLIHNDHTIGSLDHIGSKGNDPVQTRINNASAGNGSPDHDVYMFRKAWTEPTIKTLYETQMEALEERIAIMEFDGNISHEQAVRKAVRQIFNGR